MLLNYFAAFKISCIVLPVLFVLHIGFRVLIEKKYPPIILYQPDQGVCRVKLYRLAELGGMRYGTYDFWGSDGICKLYNDMDLGVQVVIPLAVVVCIFSFMDSDLHTMKIAMFVITSVFDLLIFAIIAKGRHQAYIALQKYLRNKEKLQETMPETGIVYDTKSAEDLCMAGLDQEGLMAHFPEIPKEEIQRIYKDTIVKKYNRYQKFKMTSYVIFATTFILMIIGFVGIKEPLFAGGGVLLMLIELIVLGICGLEVCPHCGRSFGRSGGGDYCWHCHKPLRKEALNLFLRENSEDTEGKPDIRGLGKTPEK